jgi:tetratricopeptide (TPR) repeat protein
MIALLQLGRQKPRLIVGIVALFLAAATFVLYSGALKNDFNGWDDSFYIHLNPYIAPLNIQEIEKIFTHYYFASWTPLTLVSHAVDYKLWGLDPRGHHLSGLLFHVADTLWVFLLVFLLISYLRNPSRGGEGRLEPRDEKDLYDVVISAAIAAAFFSWHPMRVESAVCVSSRKDVLCAFFAFPAACLYLGYVRNRPRKSVEVRYWASLALFTFALLAKAAVIAWPAFVAWLEIYDSKRRNEVGHLRKALLRTAPFLVPAGLVAYLGFEASGVLRKQSFFAAEPSPFLPLSTYWFYIQKTIVPTGLSLVYSPPGLAEMIVDNAAALLLIGGAVLAGRRGHPVVIASLVAYGLAMLPVLGIVPSSIQQLSNRYLYTASPAFSGLVGIGLYRLYAYLRETDNRTLRHWVPAFGVPALVLTVLASVSVASVGYWANGVSIWKRAAEIAPEYPIVHLNLGRWLLDADDYEGSHREMEKAIALKPDFAEAYDGLAKALLYERDTLAAEKALARALSLDPQLTEAMVDLGVVKASRGDYKSAILLFNTALRVEPSNTFAMINFAHLYAEKGEPDSALAWGRRCIAVRPTFGQAYLTVALLLLQNSPWDREGIAYLRKAAELGEVKAQRELANRGLL